MNSNAPLYPEIVELKRITTCCPSQWEGRLADGRGIYIRFRHDELSVHLFNDAGRIEDAVAAAPVMTIDTHERKWDGLIDLRDVLALTGLQLSSELSGQSGRL